VLDRFFYFYSPLSKLVQDTNLSTIVTLEKEAKCTVDVYAITTHLIEIESFLTGDSLGNVEEKLEAKLSSIAKQHSIKIHRSSDYSNNEELTYTLAIIEDILKENKSFRNLLLHYTYRNLHPRLNRIGVKNQRDPVVEQLSKFLINEVSFAIFLWRKAIYKKQIIFGNKGQFFPKVVDSIIREIPEFSEVTSDYVTLS